MDKNTSGTGAPGALPKLSDSALIRLAAAWGISPDECIAMWATAQDAINAQAEEDSSKEAFEASEREAFDTHSWPYPSRDASWAGWLARAKIAAEYEARVEDDITQRMNVTSEATNVLTAELARARARIAELEAMQVNPTVAVLAPITLGQRIAGTDAVLREVAAERVRQRAKWGEQVWPMVPEGTAWERCAILGQVHEGAAKGILQMAFDEGRGTFAHILGKEFSEAICAENDTDRRAELIQVAAVAVQMVEVIDRGQVAEQVAPRD